MKGFDMEALEQGKLIDLIALHEGVEEEYKNFVVNQVNESCVRMSVFRGEYPWHRHPGSDEAFLVVDGELIIEFLDREAVNLRPQQLFTVPAGVVHRTRAVQRTVNLCFEHVDAETEFVEV